jgi:hypothetical protein
MPSYNSTKDFLNQQKANFVDARKANKILREATINTAAAIKSRIQQQGKKQDNTPIIPKGYSTKPLGWKKITDKFSAIANARQTAKRKAKYGAKWLYFKGGYKEYRQALGRQVGYVDLTLTRDMFRAWRPIPVSNSEYGITFVTKEANDKAFYHEKRLGIIFKPTDAELKMSLDTINRKAEEILSK